MSIYIKNSSNKTKLDKDFISSLINKNAKSIMLKNECKKDNLMRKQINDIVFNEKVHIVAEFKNYLILDDNTDFFKSELKERLKKIFDFYDENSKIFPNYIILSEARYIYKNIQKKQKLIDQLQELEIIDKTKQNNFNSIEYKNKVINTEECDSIMNQTQSALCQTKNSSFYSVELLIDHIERVDFNKNSQILIKNKSKKDIVKNQIDKEKNINSYNDPTFSCCKNYELIKMVNDKLISQTNPKITDKFSMKKLILNTNKLSNPTRTNYPYKNITKKDNSSLLKFDTLKTIDMDFKINSHRDANNFNNANATLVDRNSKDNIDYLYNKSKGNRNLVFEHPSSNPKNNANQEITDKKFIYHKSTLSMPKLSSIDLNNLIRKSKIKSGHNMGSSDGKIISPKQKFKNDFEKNNIILNEKDKKNTRNFMQRENNLKNSDKCNAITSTLDISNFQSTHNMFNRNNNNQFNTISPDLISRQTLEPTSFNKFIPKKKNELENKKFNDNLKILKNQNYNNIKNTNQNYFMKKIIENKNKNIKILIEKKKTHMISKNLFENQQNILSSSKSPLMSKNLLLNNNQRIGSNIERKFSSTKDQHLIFFESTNVLPLANSARNNNK